MDKIELARKALLDTIGEEVSFPCDLSGSEGGKCGDGFSTSEDLCLNQKELMFLISDGSAVFSNLKTKKVDVEARLYQMAKEACWPDYNGNPSVYLSDNDTIPDELQGLATEIRKHDKNNAAEVADLRTCVAALKEDDYTFHVTIEESEYYFEEDEPKKLHLTGDEVRGFLKNALHGADDIFDGICDDELDEDDFSDLAEEAGIGSEYIDDNWSYSGESCALDGYIEAWKMLIGKILSGEVDENNLDKWLAFFDDPSEWEYGIESFVEDNLDD